MRNPLLLLLSAAMALSGAGCSRDSAMGSHHFAVRDSSGVRIAETTGAPRFEGELFGYEKVLEIRGDEADPASLLTSAELPSVDGRNHFYVPDSRDRRVAVYDIEGRYLYQIGRPGSGPGDLGRVATVRIWGDTLIVWPNVRSPGRPIRLSRFDRDGGLLDLLSIPYGVRSVLAYWDVTADGRIPALDRFEKREEDRYYVSWKANVLGAAGDTLASFTTPYAQVGRYADAELGGRPVEMYLLTPFGFHPFMLFQPPAQVVSSAADGEIRVFDLAGQLLRIVRVDVPPERVTEEDRAAEIARLDAEISRGQEYADRTGSSEMLDWPKAEKANLDFPEVKGSWYWGFADDRGWLWMMKPRPQGIVRESTQWSLRVFDPEGRYLGDTTWPRAVDSRPQGGYLMTIAVDAETDERVPTIYRIIGAQEGVVYP